MAITIKELENLIEQALNKNSDKDVDPSEARKQIASDLASAISAFVIGRKSTVVGTSATGGAVSGTGTLIV